MPHFHHFHSSEGPRSAATGPNLPMPSETSTELRFLEPDAAQFRRQAGRLQFRDDPAADWCDATLVRLFPLHEPDRWISVVDKEGREIGIFKDATKLARDALALVHDELRRCYLIPQIHRILACRRRADAIEWTVETDRGEQKFLTRDVREQVRNPAPKRLSLIDIEGNRYDIPSVRDLDPDSRRRLDAQL